MSIRIGETDIEKVAADEYTVFLYGEDGVLRYWDSSRIKYHDCVGVVFRPTRPDGDGPWMDANGASAFSVNGQRSFM